MIARASRRRRIAPPFRLLSGRRPAASTRSWTPWTTSPGGPAPASRARSCARLGLALGAGLLFAGSLLAEANDGGAAQPRRDPAEETSFFFGDGADLDRRTGDDLYNHAFDRGDASSGVQEETTDTGRWVDADITNLFPDLQVIDQVSAESSLQRLETARRLFNEARGILLAGEGAARAERERLTQEKTLQGWQAIDREDSIRRRENQILSRSRVEAVGYLVRAMNTMDQVRNPTVAASTQYMDLLTNIYRQYVKQQFQLRNFTHCVEVLENYLRLRPEHARDPEAHRLLAACYRYHEVLARRMQDIRSAMDFKRKKNEHLLLYARLAFGPESPEFAAIKRGVDRDLQVNEIES